MNRLFLIGVPLVTAILAVYWLFFGTPVRTTLKAMAPPQTSQGSESLVNAESERSAQLEQELVKAHVESARTEQKARALEAALATNRMVGTNASATPPNPLKDPKMRQTMQKQQLQALDRQIKQLVNADLISKLRLTPDQASQLRDLLRQKQKPAMALMIGLMAGELDDGQASEAGASVNKTIAEADEQIRALLGPEAFSYFDQQEKLDVERGNLREVKKEFDNGGHPLRAEQQEQLLAAMFDERQNFKFHLDFHEPSRFDYTRFPDYFSEENLERFYSEMQDLNARILARVEPLLDPDQRADFEHVLQEHLERGRATVRMTQALFPIKK